MGKRKSKIDWSDPKQPHPLMAYVCDSKENGMDTLNEKLYLEGFINFKTIPADSREEVVKGLLELLIELQDPTIEEIRIVPSYLANMSRYKASEVLKNSKDIGKHSIKGNYHIVYVKRKS